MKMAQHLHRRGRSRHLNRRERRPVLDYDQVLGGLTLMGALHGLPS